MANALPMELREQRPSYVEFERHTVEDRAASLREKRYMTKDVDFAIITPIGSKDRIPRQVDEWFVSLDQQQREGRIPSDWVSHYKKAYANWKENQEVPVMGTPIKGWALLSPAQQANILGANIRTVEDLAQANEEARRRIGMGATDLVEKAISWLKAAKGIGAVAGELNELKVKIKNLERELEAKEGQIAELRAENANLLAKAGVEA